MDSLIFWIRVDVDISMYLSPISITRPPKIDSSTVAETEMVAPSPAKPARDFLTALRVFVSRAFAEVMVQLTSLRWADMSSPKHDRISWYSGSRLFSASAPKKLTTVGEYFCLVKVAWMAADFAWRLTTGVSRKACRPPSVDMRPLNDLISLSTLARDSDLLAAEKSAC